MSALESRYRRLLACYPADHRAEHGEEMLDVLLSAARPGQRRPSAADAADLLYGALRIRLRHLAAGEGGSPWPGAFSITGFLAVCLLLADGLRFAVNVPYWVTVLPEPPDTGGSLPRTVALHFGTAPYWLAWVVIALLLWRGRRRAATIGACAVTAAQIAFALYGTSAYDRPWAWLGTSLAGPPLALAVLATASLLLSPGPAHGARLLGRRHVLGAGAVAAALVAFSTTPLFSLLLRGDLDFEEMVSMDVDRLITYSWTWDLLQNSVVRLAAVLVTAGLARTAQGRRAWALLAVAVAPLLVRVDLVPDGLFGESEAVFRLVAEGALGFALAMLCVRGVELPSRARARRHGRPPA
ncbi:hypothetical protein [Actinomadura litoris]|uniref:Uncharacterized protein n=1 Tax=Actinomadura litoris TaxID=2678616 RepID=A0A7K1LCB5_9ACTN|nr:hypothetical protein [Actinomadura litoris]MUN42069.1 hypothetical protein [Actinomadura litoris]